MTLSPLADPRVEALLAELHALDKRQFFSIVRRYLPRALLSWATSRFELDAWSSSEAAFLRDKLVALDPDKGKLAYTFCRAMNARLAVEVGTSFGVSTIYLAAALRDNAAAGAGPCRVIGTELEPTKVAAARRNLTAAGLEQFVEVREGDALQTLKTLDAPIDFLLIDTWIPLALPALQLLAPRLRPGAVVMCDNVRQFARDYRAYTDHVRNPDNGFRSMLWPGQGGIELSIRQPVA